MKKIVFTFFLAILTCTFSFGQDLTNPKGGGVLDIITIIPGDGYSLKTTNTQMTQDLLN